MWNHRFWLLAREWQIEFRVLNIYEPLNICFDDFGIKCQPAICFSYIVCYEELVVYFADVVTDHLIAFLGIHCGLRKERLNAWHLASLCGITKDIMLKHVWM